MSDHDPLCPGDGPTAPFPFPVCVCAIITQVRADERGHMESAVYLAMMEKNLTDQIVQGERERIARAIEAQCEADEPPCLGCWTAARIARGGSDE